MARVEMELAELDEIRDRVTAAEKRVEVTRDALQDMELEFIEFKSNLPQVIKKTSETKVSVQVVGNKLNQGLICIPYTMSALGDLFNYREIRFVNTEEDVITLFNSSENHFVNKHGSFYIPASQIIAPDSGSGYWNIKGSNKPLFKVTPFPEVITEEYCNLDNVKESLRIDVENKMKAQVDADMDDLRTEIKKRDLDIANLEMVKRFTKESLEARDNQLKECRESIESLKSLDQTHCNEIERLSQIVNQKEREIEYLNDKHKVETDRLRKYIDKLEKSKVGRFLKMFISE